jgi:hypothetical protein
VEEAAVLEISCETVMRDWILARFVVPGSEVALTKRLSSKF